MGEDIAFYGGAFGAYKGLIQNYGANGFGTHLFQKGIGGSSGWISYDRHAGQLLRFNFSDFITIAFRFQLVNQAAKNSFICIGEKFSCYHLVCETAAGSGTGHAAQHSQVWKN